MSSIKLSPNASGTGEFTIAAPNSNTNRTLSLPDQTGTVVTTSADALNIGSGQLVKDASGNVGIGTSSPTARLTVVTGSPGNNEGEIRISENATYYAGMRRVNATDEFRIGSYGASQNITFYTVSSERARIDSSGNLLVGKTSSGSGSAGVQIEPAGAVGATRSGDICFFANRLTNDGSLFSFRQDNTEEGNISVSGTTVSYNGGHLSRWAQTEGPKDTTLVKGTVLSNLDVMNVYTDAEGNPVPNEQLNKVKVSDVEGDPNVAGVFVNWSHDEQHNVDEINMAMTGDMIIRIGQGVTVQRGDLLMSAGDGTAKPQGDDIVRSKTVAKVTSTHVTCTYEDGSYCVPCVLMAC
jgi:hypothetical protein